MTSEIKDTNDDEGPRSFSIFLGQIAEGEAEGNLSVELHKLMRAVRDEAVFRQDKAKGKLTLAINFVGEPGGFVGVGYNIETKAPKHRTTAGIFFLTKGANLTPENPKQTKLPLREVKAWPREPAREAPAARVAAVAGQNNKEPDHDPETGEVS